MDKRTVKFLRTSNGLNRQQFADKVGVSRQLISAIEQGERRLTPRVADKIRTAFGLTADDVERLRELIAIISLGAKNQVKGVESNEPRNRKN